MFNTFIRRKAVVFITAQIVAPCPPSQRGLLPTHETIKKTLAVGLQVFYNTIKFLNICFGVTSTERLYRFQTNQLSTNALI